MISKFDKFLSVHGAKFEAVIIGGSALIVLKIIQRETIDIDCLTPVISKHILDLAQEFRDLNPNLHLTEKWINNGPESLVRDLSPGWRERVEKIFEGKALTFFTLGRLDLLKTKLFAFCDRAIDFKDCIAMKPTAAELNDAIEWVKDRDANPEWPTHVEKQFIKLKKSLGYE